VHFRDEVLQHLLGDEEVGDDAILQRPYRGDVSGRPAEHPFGIEADRCNALLIVLVADRDN
jgi:hypothetical protein